MYVKQFTLPYCLWQYNNIMGYIKISASKSDIFFDIYKSSCQKYSYKSKRKKFIQNIYANKVCDTFEEAVDLCLEALEKQLVKYKEKQRSK